jgi:enoyl-CoA hydratase/carnithine racemase
MPGELHRERSGAILVLTLDNPAKRNALDGALCAALADALTRAAETGARAVVLTGAGERAFSAGFDLDELDQPGGPQQALPAGGRSPLNSAEAAFRALIDAVAAAPLPIVCAVNGGAFGGGCELAATCDLRVAAPGVKLGLPPARLGVVYHERGLARFAALVGESRARQLFLAARTLDVETALAWGLVDEIAADPRARARAWAEEIAALAPLAVQGMRRAFELLVLRRAELAPDARAELAALRRAAWASEESILARARATKRS